MKLKRALLTFPQFVNLIDCDGYRHDLDLYYSLQAWLGYTPRVVGWDSVRQGIADYVGEMNTVVESTDDVVRMMVLVQFNPSSVKVINVPYAVIDSLVDAMFGRYYPDVLGLVKQWTAGIWTASKKSDVCDLVNEYRLLYSNTSIGSIYVKSYLYDAADSLDALTRLYDLGLELYFDDVRSIMREGQIMSIRDFQYPFYLKDGRVLLIDLDWGLGD